MKNLVILIVISTSFVFGQAKNNIILEAEYDKLPIEISISNSGIYGVSHFKIVENNILLYDFNKSYVHTFSKNSLVKSTPINPQKLSSQLLKNESLQTLKENNNLYYNFENGELKNNRNEEFNINVCSTSSLDVDYKHEEKSKKFSLSFPDDLAYANLIGIDKENFIFLIVERYVQQVPLKVRRQVYTLSPYGNICSVLDLPDTKYLFTLSDLTVDEDGNLYHLFSSKKGIKIIKWQGLKILSKTNVKYSEEYYHHFHYNQILPTNEIKNKNYLGKTTAGSRAKALRIAENYVYHKYNCTSSNLAPDNVTAPDGDIVRTPARLIVGANARVPYKWGGFNTLDQFNDGLSNGLYAGDINTAGVSSSAVGVDCSGYVSRCWQLSYHASTSYMPNITGLYNNWSELKPGDAVHKVGHVRLYISTQSNGSIKVAESTSRGWGVSYWNFAPSDLTDYSPRYYTGMSDDYYENQPKLISIIQESDNKIKIQWECNDSEVLGYRLYRSVDRVNWTLLLDENTLQEKYANDVLAKGALYYRVSSVRNNSLNISESDLSNELGTGKTDSETKYLIVDGFDRESGSWRGAGHKFAGYYGKSLFKNGVSFETIKSEYLTEPDFNLSDYSGIFWISGDESTVDETFNSYEQSTIINYLENGGKLFVSGSEIGWDLDYKGTSTDKSFYNNYLKADYLSDDAGSVFVNGVSESSLETCSFNIGQTYDEDYPDEIASFGGSSVCMRYSNNKGAGIQFAGSFGTSTQTSKIVYLAFPLETTANDDEFDNVISNVHKYFLEEIVSVGNNQVENLIFHLSQNYPNPFNPTTIIRYQIPKHIQNNNVTLKIFDVLGNEVATLVDDQKSVGNYQVTFNSENFSSGVYLYRLRAGNYILSKKMLLIK
jgi:cell wall-associated NlpC family hydrolase